MYYNYISITWEHFKSKSELLKSSAIGCLFNKLLIHIRPLNLSSDCIIRYVNILSFLSMKLIAKIFYMPTLYASIMFKIMST